MTQEQLHRTDETLHRVQQLAAAGHYNRAVQLLHAAGRDRRVLNTKGVCLLRLGRIDEAVKVKLNDRPNWCCSSNNSLESSL